MEPALALVHADLELARATYEAIAFGVRHNLQAFREAAGEPARVVAVGGGTKAGAWTQIVSDATRLRQEIPEQAIGAAYGDALLAALAAGLVAPDTDWSASSETVVPSPDGEPVYDDLFALYLQLQQAAAPISHRLAELQTDGWS